MQSNVWVNEKRKRMGVINTLYHGRERGKERLSGMINTHALSTIGSWFDALHFNEEAN